MTAVILSGTALAETIRAEIALEAARFREQTGVVPCLAAVLVGSDAASEVYVRNKRKACERAGIESRLERLSAETSVEELLSLLARLNEDTGVHGILVQLPLPSAIDSAQVLDAVHPAKDVDCFHPENVGRLLQGRPRFLPCTPQGVMELLTRSGVELAGRHVVIVGRSDIVGKPLAAMLVQRGVDATVTVCHSRTRDLAEITRLAEILVVAIGKPRFITPDMVRPHAVVVDVGINRLADRIVGDVDSHAVSHVASRITPVPGGVGPLTVTMLLRNTLAAAREQAVEAQSGELGTRSSE